MSVEDDAKKSRFKVLSFEREKQPEAEPENEAPKQENSELVSALEEWLNLAKDCKLSSIALVGIGPEGGLTWEHHGDDETELYFGLDLMKMNMLNDFEADYAVD